MRRTLSDRRPLAVGLLADRSPRLLRSDRVTTARACVRRSEPERFWRAPRRCIGRRLGKQKQEGDDQTPTTNRRISWIAVVMIFGPSPPGQESLGCYTQRDQLLGVHRRRLCVMLVGMKAAAIAVFLIAVAARSQTGPAVEVASIKQVDHSKSGLPYHLGPDSLTVNGRIRDFVIMCVRPPVLAGRRRTILGGVHLVSDSGQGVWPIIIESADPRHARHAPRY